MCMYTQKRAREKKTHAYTHRHTFVFSVCECVFAYLCVYADIYVTARPGYTFHVLSVHVFAYPCVHAHIYDTVCPNDTCGKQQQLQKIQK